jgi:hypothetical protein
MRRGFVTSVSQVQSQKGRVAPLVCLLICLGWATSACVSGDLTESWEVDESERPSRHVAKSSALSAAPGALGSTCTSGCIWSSFAVNTGIQEASHSCASVGCVCVQDGNVYERCVPDVAENSARATVGLGEACGSGRCIWSALSVRLGAQPSGGDCGGAPCACVVEGNIWESCGGATESVDQPQPRSRPSANPAEAILAHHRSDRLTLWDQSFGRFDGADPLQNIRDAAAGVAAKTSCYGTAPCTGVYLQERLLRAMRDLHDVYGFGYFVTSIVGASHSYGSLHYAGRAVDIDEVNGVLIRGDSQPARDLMAACRAMGAVEVFGPSNDPYGHRDHVHCAW